MSLVIKDINRVLKKGRYMALYVSDSYEKDKPFMPIDFRMFSILSQYLTPIDIIAVMRHNSTMGRGNWKKAAAEYNYFLRGFNYLFVMLKEDNKKKDIHPDRRDLEEKEK